MLLFGVLTGIVLCALALERWRHRRSLQCVRLRIHVNGIRGKSSVTRLIAAGLRAGGLRTWGKVTGTLPSIIDERGSDIPIARMAAASIGEQRAVIAEAARAGVEALVIECMAVKPLNQALAEDGFVNAGATVITNIREDHVEVYGRGWEGAADALLRTIPRGGVLFTTDGPALPVLRRAAERRKCRVVIEHPDVDEAMMSRFSYVEHADNVAVALAVCEWAGVAREVALEGMVAATPDPGALRLVRWSECDRRILLVNALAANDRQSTVQLYDQIVLRGSHPGPRLVLFNTRKDRPLRTRQLAEALPGLGADVYFLVGSDARQATRYATQCGIDPARIVTVAGVDVDAVAEAVLARASEECLLFAMGNTAGVGLALVHRAEASA